MEFRKPISSHLGKLIAINDGVGNNLKIQTPPLRVYQITDSEIIVEPDRGFKLWLHKFYTTGGKYFKHYLPKNKQSTILNWESSYLSVKLKDKTDFFHKLSDTNDIFMNSSSNINIGDTVILILETTGVWVNEKHYGITWIAKQILSIVPGSATTKE